MTTSNEPLDTPEPEIILDERPPNNNKTTTTLLPLLLINPQNNDKILERCQLMKELECLECDETTPTLTSISTSKSTLITAPQQTEKKFFTFKEYCMILYYNFIRKGSPHMIQFSDKQLIADIEKVLFSTQIDQKDGTIKKCLRSTIPFNVYDKMWLAVFRYVHQMCYEQFVIWLNSHY
ncbi:hypothetical protein RFI_02535 [Reticulomyxa filosa]|uniref:Uncharacterized protein n=1 Tax=Reticulomyxa filosa TaxID=46433 RepID=X6P8M8_RETFI|nr:hypothetical protein RFI_02535 [Reticulomyxa filosa]|eukprot:ETO34556.1 hypothetical protein RFI_02535 [Reticulomyxa filosa]